MGKRKSAAPKRQPRRITEKPQTQFKCPFCNHDGSVEVHMDRKIHRGEARCRVCMENFSASIDALSDPIDVYTDWIDECERINGGGPVQKKTKKPAAWYIVPDW